MRLVFWFVALAACSGYADAAWTRVGASSDVAGVYADPVSKRSAKGMVHMTSLLDYNTTQSTQSLDAKPYLTQIDRREYDCSARKHRLLRFTLRSGHMGKGKVVKSGPPDGAWRPIAPGSIGEALWRVACD